MRDAIEVVGAVRTRGATGKVTVTGGAGSKKSFPACVATMVQLPAARSVTSRPLAVHTLGVELASVTVSGASSVEALEVATTGNVPSP